MALGIRIELPVALTDNTLPVASLDPLIVPGSLLLVDPAHPASAWAAGVPGDTTLLTNLAQKQARAVLANSSAEVRPSWSQGSSMPGSKGVVERSTKGGMHVICGKTVFSAVDLNFRAGVVLPQAILDYITANPTHSYYFSQWKRVTRASGETSAGVAPKDAYLGDFTNIGTNYFFVLHSDISRPSATPPMVGARGASGADVTGPAIRNIAHSAATGTIPTLTGRAANWGFIGSGSTAAKLNSFVLYRAYMEDLTVSGRSYATVDAADLALYTAAVATSGGRYYGDTYTDPTTIA